MLKAPSGVRGTHTCTPAYLQRDRYNTMLFMHTTTVSTSTTTTTTTQSTLASYHTVWTTGPSCTGKPGANLTPNGCDTLQLLSAPLSTPSPKELRVSSPTLSPPDAPHVLAAAITGTSAPIAYLVCATGSRSRHVGNVINSALRTELQKWCKFV